ncbi:MAG: TonB family protein [Bacteroidales bacterium]|nr:TonB family protein [Bacteroidales bacterium]
MMYAIYSSIVLALLYWVFFAFLSQETFHRMNRITLLLILALSLVLPVLPHNMDFSFLEQLGRNVGVMQESAVSSPEIIVEDTGMVEQPQENSTWNWKEAAGYIYFGGMVIFIVVFLYRTVLLLLYMRQGLKQTDKYGNTIILKPACKSPFSVLKFIVMSVEDYEEHQTPVLLHEQEHIRQAHSWDLILLSVVQCIQWFNPFVWMLGRDLKVIHEYEADKAMLDYGVDIKNYQYLLVNKSNGPSAFTLVNGFNHSQLISRIIMLNKKRSKSTAMVRYLIFLPMLLLSFVLTAKPVEQVKEVVKFEEIDVSNTLPEFPDGAKAMMQFIEKNLKYPEGCDKEGSVIVQFVVDVDGSIKSPVIARSIDPLLDAEAIRLVKSMPNWRPGVQDGKLAMSKYTIPVHFRKKEPEAITSEAAVSNELMKIEGIVVDADTREPIEGAVVKLDGSSKGTVCSPEGTFSLEVQKGQTLVFLFPAYKTKKVVIQDYKKPTIPLEKE